MKFMDKAEEVFRCALKYKSEALISHFTTPFKIDLVDYLPFFHIFLELHICNTSFNLVRLDS